MKQILRQIHLFHLSETSIEDPTRLDKQNVYAILPNSMDDFEKRRSLMRFGKRGSLMRFGKRGSILRFGKRSSLMRFGKRSNPEADSDDFSNFAPSDFFDYPAEEFRNTNGLRNNKRGSLMRFGKRSSLMRFGRNSDNLEKKPHTPWRFGREEDYYMY